MSDKAKLTKPRAKQRRFTKLEFPFPVPQQKNKDSNVWYYYEGFLRSNCVVVKNVGDLTFLYKMVCASILLLQFSLLSLTFQSHL